MPPGLFDFAGCGGGIEKVPRATSKAPEADTMDSLIAADLNQLSIQERESVFEEVHGIAKVQEKSPEEEAALVRELREELKNIRGKPELERAQFLCSSYADDPKFLLMFLRSENFVVKSAAVRMVTHFKHKLHLFGIEKLAKPITLEDLDDDDMDALLTGWVQPLSQKDRSGRPVLFLFNKALKYKSVENQVRIRPPFLLFKHFTTSILTNLLLLLDPCRMVYNNVHARRRRRCAEERSGFSRVQCGRFILQPRV